MLKSSRRFPLFGFCDSENFCLSMATKLSKRKQKALAFRGKKVDAKDREADEAAEEAKALPIDDNTQDVLTTSWLGKDASSKKSKKRKRNDDEMAKTEKPKPTTDSSKENLKKTKTTEDRPPPKRPKQSKEPGAKRYIVFVGNLPHQPSETLLPAIKAHFPAQPKSIRIPTKKGTNAPQGYAFLEFDSPPDLEKALRCHHTKFLGRKINVELTAGGGGHGENRMGKIKKKNEGLEEERRKRIEEEKKEKVKKGLNEGIHPDRLRRMEK